MVRGIQRDGQEVHRGSQGDPKGWSGGIQRGGHRDQEGWPGGTQIGGQGDSKGWSGASRGVVVRGLRGGQRVPTLLLETKLQTKSVQN